MSAKVSRYSAFRRSIEPTSRTNSPTVLDIVNVALLRHLRHHQMVAHQEHHQVDFLAVEPQPAAYFGGQQGAALVMVVAVALADVVQQQREKHQRQRIEFARDLGQQRRCCP